MQHHELLRIGKEVSEEPAVYYTLKLERAGYSKTQVKLSIHKKIKATIFQ
jgi:hypothetical protein